MSPNLCDLMQFSRRSDDTSTMAESQGFLRAWRNSESASESIDQPINCGFTLHRISIMLGAVSLHFFLTLTYLHCAHISYTIYSYKKVYLHARRMVFFCCQRTDMNVALKTRFLPHHRVWVKPLVVIRLPVAVVWIPEGRRCSRFFKRLDRQRPNGANGYTA